MSRQRLRVLVLSTSYPLRRSSSSGVFVRRLVEALSAHCAMTVLCPADVMPVPAGEGGAVEVVPFRYGPRRWQRLAQTAGGVLPALRAQPALFVLLPVFLGSLAFALLRRARHADVIHANWAICGALAGLLRGWHRRPVVVTLRGDDVTVAARSRVHRRLLQLAVGRATAVVCVAETMAQTLRAALPDCAGKVRVALNGVGGEFAAGTAGALAGSRLVFVGSLIPRKGVDVLLRAFAGLQRADLRLRIVGDGPDRDALLALAQELGVASQVEFVGQVAPDAVAPLIADSGIFVLPSYSEGRPNVLLEAMAAGLAIAATRIPGVIDSVADGRHAWLFEPGDDAALRAVLADMLDNPSERARRGAAARDEVVARGWTWAATAHVYAQVFSEAAASPARAAPGS